MINKLPIYFIAAVWFINGLFCKVLNLTHRHQEIVTKILKLDDSTARTITVFIGISEILMAVWIISRIKSKLNAITQIVIIATMNILEFLLAPELLLWGKLNTVFAMLFMLIIYYQGFILNKEKQHA